MAPPPRTDSPREGIPLKTTTAFVAGLWLSLPVLASANVYRCANAQGAVAYQSQPCADTDASRKLEIDSHHGSAASPAAPRLISPELGSAPAPSGLKTRSAPSDNRTIDSKPVMSAPALKPQGSSQSAASASGPTDMSQWGAQADTLVVSAYEFTARATQVVVDHPARPVLLVLSSYNGTHWQVQVQPGTRLLGIVVGSYEDQSVVSGPPQVPVVTDQVPYAYEADNIKFRSLMRRLNVRYGVTQVTALRGSYRMPGTITLRGPFVLDPSLTLVGTKPQPTTLKMNFALLSVDGRRLPWTNTGPGEGKRFTGIVRGGGVWARSKGAPAAVRDDGAEAYELDGNGGDLVWLPKGFSGPKQKVEVPKSLPPLSWGSAMAWDQTKGVLSLVSFGGEGYFYRYDTRRREWLGATSLRNRDLTGLAHDSRTGRYVGISNAAELLVFNERGEVDEVLALRDQLTDLGSVYDRGNERLDSLSVAIQGTIVSIINIRDNTVTHIWTYDLSTRKARLTYKATEA
ncbi:DUF4124 domain-containing protein [Roseateles sp. SL47]|nr:DUF4124 domain-containing protein [Roseateles sp. SL47]